MAQSREMFETPQDLVEAAKAAYRNQQKEQDEKRRNEETREKQKFAQRVQDTVQFAVAVSHIGYDSGAFCFIGKDLELYSPKYSHKLYLRRHCTLCHGPMLVEVNGLASLGRAILEAEANVPCSACSPSNRPNERELSLGERLEELIRTIAREEGRR